MKRLFLVLTIAAGALTAKVLYERLFVERWFGPSSIAAMLVLVAGFALLLASYRLYESHTNKVLGAWLVLVFTVVPFLALDLIAGHFLIKPLSAALNPDPNRHHSLIPNSYSLIEQRDFRYVMRVNNLGLRGRDATEAKPHATFRILMLGDSFAMGKGVQEDETSSVLLEHRLNARTAACGGVPVQVLNGGVDSYAPVLSLIQLRQLRGLGSDVIIENLDVSDLVQEQSYRSIGVFDPNRNPIRVPAPQLANPTVTARVRSWIDAHLFFTRWIIVSINKMFNYADIGTAVSQANPEIVNYTLIGDTVDRRKEWDDIFDSLVRMKALSDSAGAHFVLAVYPWPHQYSDTSWIPGRYAFMSKTARPSEVSVNTITGHAAQDSIELFSAYPQFRAYHGNQSLYYKYDMHWTSAGARVMAEALGDYIESKYLGQLCRKP